ncbi:MAG: M50 family metallopeptidase [archaeon]
MFSLIEIFDLMVMTAITGFIFKDLFKRRHVERYDPIKSLTHRTKSLGMTNFYFAIAVTAPAIILHEMGHKFVAMGFGATATFHAAYPWLMLGLVLRLMNFSFIFFVPGYVQYATAGLTAFQSMLIAGAGPFVNLAIWAAALLVLRYKKDLSPTALQGWTLTKRINLFLFFFNMLPIPPFDGSSFFSSLFAIFG